MTRGNILYLHYKYDRGMIQGVLFVLFSLLLIDHCHFTIFRPVQLEDPETEVQYRLLPVIKPAEHLFHLSRHNWRRFLLHLLLSRAKTFFIPSRACCKIKNDSCALQKVSKRWLLRETRAIAPYLITKHPPPSRKPFSTPPLSPQRKSFILRLQSDWLFQQFRVPWEFIEFWLKRILNRDGGPNPLLEAIRWIHYIFWSGIMFKLISTFYRGVK